MDLSHDSITSLSIGQPMDNASDNALGAFMDKASRRDLMPVYSRGLKRKRSKYMVSSKDASSGFPFKNDAASGLSLALTRSDCLSLSRGESETEKVRMWSMDAGDDDDDDDDDDGDDESHPELGLGLAGTQTSSLDACNASLITGERSSLTSVHSGFRPYIKTNKGREARGNVLTALGLSQARFPPKPDSQSSEKESFSWVNVSPVEMQLQLGLAAGNPTIISDSGNLASMPKASEYDGGQLAMAAENLCVDSIPLVDEGSTSARSVTAGGYIPSLLMGLRPESVTRLEIPREKPNFEGDRDYVLHAGNDDLVNEKMSQTVDLFGNKKVLTAGMASGNGLASPAEKLSRRCKVKGCDKVSRGASGLCMSHGGGRRCGRPGCNKAAEGRTIYCKSHGGGRRCETLGCTKSAEGKTDHCIGHGGGRRCSYDGCMKAARGRSGLCIKHGGGKRCMKEGCTKSAEGYSGLCISHGGGRRCQHEGCGKGAQGSTQFCKAHGGGKRCMIQGCNKGAEGSTPLCKGHGGGKRCMFEGGGICTKSVHGGTPFCVAHGGGKRCAVQGCTKSARGKTDFCVRHGGGKRCKIENCTKSAQGSTDFCKAHGGGKRCQWGQESSPYFESFRYKTSDLFKGPCDRFARGKIGLCAAHSALVQDRRVHGADTIGNALPAGIGPGLFRGLVVGATQKETNLVHDNINHAPVDGVPAPIMQADKPDKGDDSRKESESHLSPEFTRGYTVGMKFSGSGSNKVRDYGQPLNSITFLSSNINIWPRHASFNKTQGRNSSNHSLGKFRSPNTKLVTNVSALPVTAAHQLAQSSNMFHRPLLPPQVLVPPSMQKASSPFASHQKLTSLSFPEERVHGNSVMALLTGNNRTEG